MEPIARQFTEMIEQLGYDLSDENFQRTPERAAKWLASFSKLDENAFLENVLDPVFPEDHDEMVIVGPIEFTSLCAHHMLPFRGTGWVGYIPSKGVVGISKLARALKGIAHQMTLQEHITRVVADGIYEILKCKGVMVVLRADHLCMQMRGVKDEYAQTTTSAVRGCFSTNQDGCKDEFLELIRR